MIDFVRYKIVYFVLSASVLVPGLFALWKWGLLPDVDFTGGTLLQVEAPEKLTKDQLQESFQKEDIKVLAIQAVGQKSFLVRTPPLNQNELNKIQTLIPKIASDTAIVREESVGPILGQELLVKTLVAVFLASLAIVTYVAFRFKFLKYGVCAVLAMFHDTGVLLGSFALLGYFAGVTVDTLFVTAVLTVLSFSVHDTIVVYDRIRESSRKNPGIPYPQIVNRAINETLIRSLNNSLTIIFMLLALTLFGGETIRWFVVALLIGTISGTYSSTFTAAQLLLVWDDVAKRLRRQN